MSAILIGIANSAVPSFPKATDTHRISENRVLWNEEHHKAEECELVYEVSWVPELSTWRSFLRSRRWLEARQRPLSSQRLSKTAKTLPEHVGKRSLLI